MPKIKNAFCYFDDALEQYGDYHIFYQKEKSGTQLLFLYTEIIEISHIYMFEFIPKNETIHLVYRNSAYGSPKTVDISCPEGVNFQVAELYEWLYGKFFAEKIQVSTCSPPPKLTLSQDK
jgi:hypothetical protein